MRRQTNSLKITTLVLLLLSPLSLCVQHGDQSVGGGRCVLRVCRPGYTHYGYPGTLRKWGHRTQKHPLFVPHRIAYSSELSHRWQDENGEREKGDHHFLATLSPKDGQFRDNAFTDICLRWGGEDTHVTTEGYKVIVLARALLSAASKTCTRRSNATPLLG